SWRASSTQAGHRPDRGRREGTRALALPRASTTLSSAALLSAVRDSMTGTVKHRYRIAGLVALFALIAGVALVVSLRTRNRLEPPLEPGQPSVGAESPRRADLPAASESAAPAAEAPAPAAESTSEPTTELPATEPSESEPLGTASGPRAANRIDVYPGDDLVTIVNTAPEGSFIFLHGRPDGSGYTYDIGDRVLTLPNGATIR